MYSINALELFTVRIDQNLIALNVRNDEIYDNCIFELYKVFVTKFNSITLLTFKFFFLKFFITIDV